MRTHLTFIFAILILLLVSCFRNGNTPAPDEKKQYVWACGRPDSTGYGMILFSPDGGDSWTRQGNNNPALLGIYVSDIWAVDENNVWAAGSKNTVLKSTDGGNTWKKITLPENPANPDLVSISIVNKTNIWISGANGTIYHSADDGNSWTLCDTSFFNHAFLQGVWAVDQSKVYVVGSPGVGGSGGGFAAYTLNGGITWDSLVPAEKYNKNEWIGAAASGNTVVIYGTKAHYMVSTDGGTTWKNKSVPGTGGAGGDDINHLIMLDAQTWWGAFDMGAIYITHDGGENWTYQETGQGGYFLLGIDAWNDQLAVAVGARAESSNNCPIIKTSNGGSLWEKKFTTSNSSLEKVTFIKN